MGVYSVQTKNIKASTDGSVVTITERGMGGAEMEFPAQEALPIADIVQLSNGYLQGNLQRVRYALEAIRDGDLDGVSPSTMARDALELLPEESD